MKMNTKMSWRSYEERFKNDLEETKRIEHYGDMHIEKTTPEKFKRRPASMSKKGCYGQIIGSVWIEFIVAETEN